MSIGNWRFEVYEVILMILILFLLTVIGIILFKFKSMFNLRGGAKDRGAVLAGRRLALEKDVEVFKRYCVDAHRKAEEAEKRRDSMRDEISALKDRSEKAKCRRDELAGQITRLEEDIRKAAEEIDELTRRTNRIQDEMRIPYKFTVNCKPNEEFKVSFKIQGEQHEPKYPELIRGASRFELPPELPPINGDTIEWAFPDARKGRAVVIDAEKARECAGRLFFVGDIHGDADALRRVATQIFRTNEKAILVFLGDLFDRGTKSIEAARLLIWLAKKFPGQVLWLAGNHDIGFRYDENVGQFLSEVTPSEFKDWLNENPSAKDEGIALANLIKDLPVVCVIGSTWASHGGVPQSDVCENFKSFEEMDQLMIEDCVWSRMKDVPEKLPNRSHHGAEVGYRNALKFFEAFKSATGIEIRHIVCAHQHEQKNGVGYLPFEKQFKPDSVSCQCIFSFYDEEHSANPCYLVYCGEDIAEPRGI